jgi:hypothetical protein
MAVNIEQEILDWYNVNDIGVEASSVDSEVWDEFYESIHTKEHTERFDWAKTAVLPSGPAYIVEDVGGGEGDGEERYVVFQVGDQFFQVDGYYASWDGTTWEDTTPYEVKPKEVTVIQYERA